MVTAYNLYLAFSVLLIGGGMYVWMRIIGLSGFPALFAGATVMYSGIIIPRLTHVMVIPALGMLPWIMLGVHLLSQRITRWRVLFCIFLINQLVLVNFPQATFIILLFASTYFFFLTRILKNSWIYWAVFGISILLSVALAAVQLVPTWEYYKQSVVSGGFSPETASFFSFPVKHLLTFFHPFALGNPRDGSYPPFWEFDGSVFWENSGFIGILPLVLILVSAIRRAIPPFFAGSLVVSFFLMLGKYSPLYLVYSVPPFSTFRVPSRFLWIFVISLIVMASHELEYWWTKNKYRKMFRLVLMCTVLIHVISAAGVWWDYHAINPAKNVLAQPEIFTHINKEARVFTIGLSRAQNNLFTEKGWVNPDPYVFLNNTLAPNVNALWSIPQSDAYSALRIRRSALLDSLLSEEISIMDNHATISAQAHKLFTLASVGSIVSLLDTQHDGLTEKTILSFDPFVLRVYDNPAALPRAYTVSTATSAASVAEAVRILASDTFVPGQTVLLEKADLTGELKQFITPNKPSTSKAVQIRDETATSFTIDVYNDQAPSVLVLTDTWYPGWGATIDGIDTTVYPANLAQRAVVVPAGQHMVSFQYKPASFMIGSTISAVTLIFIAVLMVLPFPSVFVRTGQKVRPLSSHRPHSRDT